MPKLCEDTMLKPAMDIRAHWHMSINTWLVVWITNIPHVSRMMKISCVEYTSANYTNWQCDIYMGFIKNVFTFISFRVGDITNRCEKSNLASPWQFNVREGVMWIGLCLIYSFLYAIYQIKRWSSFIPHNWIKVQNPWLQLLIWGEPVVEVGSSWSTSWDKIRSLQ